MHRIAEADPEWASVPFFEVPDASDEPYRWRVKVTRFRGSAGFELTASLVDREKALERFERYGGFGAPLGPRTPGAEANPDSLRRCRQRSKTRVRHLAKNLGVSHLLTLSTRQRANTREEMDGYWARFLRIYERVTGARLPFIKVLERHPTNPEHLHIHAAVTSFLPVNRLRRLWYIALGGKGHERGADTPGGVHMRSFLTTHASRRSARIARYIAKYMTKDTAEEFNKKRYSASRDAADGLEQSAMWLQATERSDVLSELLTVFGLDVYPEDFWALPSGRLIWAQRVVTDLVEVPPF